MKESYRNVLIAGNDGSTADSEHIADELMKGLQFPVSNKRICRKIKVH